MEELDKKYYKMRDVVELLGVPATTLRYWEQEFPEIKPKRSQSNQRYYTPDNIRTLRMINYLMRVKGLRLEAAKAELRADRNNISRRLECIDLLTDTRQRLEQMLASLTKRR